MMNEFPEVYNELFANSIKRLMKELKIKKDAIEQCEEAQLEGRENMLMSGKDEQLIPLSGGTGLHF